MSALKEKIKPFGRVSDSFDYNENAIRISISPNVPSSDLKGRTINWSRIINEWNISSIHKIGNYCTMQSTITFNIVKMHKKQRKMMNVE